MGEWELNMMSPELPDSWKQAPEGKILKSDVTVAKNYLSEAHIKELKQIGKLTIYH